MAPKNTSNKSDKVDIRQLFPVINKEWREGISIKHPSAGVTVEEDRVETNSALPVHEIHGFKNEIKSMKNFLLDQKVEKEFKSLVIVGEYGVGKTSLCKTIFNDKDVKSVYAPRIWVSLHSKETEADKKKISVLTRILNCLVLEDDMFESIYKEARQVAKEMGENDANIATEEISALLYALHLNLRWKKYLIVFDDVREADEWNQILEDDEEKLKKDEKWGKYLSDGFPKGSDGFPKGSGGRVIYTTRDESLAKKLVAEEHEIHRLWPLTDTKSVWDIYAASLKDNEKEIPRKDQKCIDELMNKSRGLPLAARLMGMLIPVFAPAPDKTAEKNSSSHGQTNPASEEDRTTQPLQDADEIVKEVSTPEDTIRTARSCNVGQIVDNTTTTQEDTIKTPKSYNIGEIVEETTTPELPTGGGSVLNRTILQLDVNTEMKKQLHSLNDMSSTYLIKNELEVITKNFSDMIRLVPVRLKKQKKKKASIEYQHDDAGNKRRPIHCLPAIHANEGELKRLAVFRRVQQEFEKLPDFLMICLLTFAVFPENQEVNRTMLMYWWIGEGILPEEFKLPEEDSLLDEAESPGKGILLDNVEPKKSTRPDKDRPETVVKAILDYFTERKLIEAVENKRKVEPNSYKMTPFMHSSVVLISKEIGLFDMYHEGEKPRMKQSKLHRVCLVEGSSSQPEAKAKNMPEVHRIETVFNVSERFPEFTFKWFSKDLPLRMKRFGILSISTYKALKVFYLGRWERTSIRHIEVQNPKLMKFLKHMTKLKFLSFQGISTIRSLSRSACKLRELIILDLRDCYNLEKLPDDIHNLKNLVYLDLTGCEALQIIPAQLAWLSKLEVLKGFVVSDNNTASTCKLIDLYYLKKLRSLSITVDRENFGLNDLIKAIQDFDNLEKLKVQWGSRFPLSMKKQGTEQKEGAGQRFIMRSKTIIIREDGGHVPAPPPSKLALPKRLRKLDLQRFPDSKLPDGLQPQNIKYLEKLYLQSSKRLKRFSDLPKEPTDCRVKVLRLTCLPKLKVEWRELKELYFPKLTFLESYECPRVTFCPCD
ncbi:hypothetical protein AALP_AAs69373U000200 [Arabis alpina]|uniref:NB-ARC domain-containing protein n=1 Tax=Arabis alpina TaxID=50452 RepID=A0A087G233_ARAAL|nr:hypothetical protein AALP_AAs69373U000200 [Arabis alpina]